MDDPNFTGLNVSGDATPQTLVQSAIRLMQVAEFKFRPKPTPTIGEQLRHFIKHFRDNPVKNTILVLSVTVLLVLLVIAAVVGSRREQERENLRRESQAYVAQTQELDNVKKSLNNLLDFVQTQKDKLQESEDIVNRLRAEQEKLKPLVETDRKVIDAILDLQAQRARSDVWKERGIGFGTGILASIIAAFLFRFFERTKLA